MKKLFFALVLSLGTMTAFAQEADATQEEATQVASQDSYSEVAVEELPEAVTAAVSKNYPTATIDKAYVSSENKYKLEVSLQDGTSGTLYADEQGNWIDQ